MAAGALTGPSAARAADIEFMSWTYAEEAGRPSVQALLDGFSAQTGIAVETIGYAWGDMQRNVWLRQRSGTLPDVIQLQERWLPSHANMPELVDLNEVFGREALEARFAPDALALGRIGDRQMALPWISGTIGMVANAAVLEEAGIAEMPTTVAEFKAALEAVRDKIPRSVPYAMATQNNSSILLDFMIWVWVHGGNIVTEDGEVVVDSEAGHAALSFMTSLVRERLAAPEVDRPDSRRLFAQNAAAFYFDAPQARTHIRTFSGQGEAIDPIVRPITTPVLAQGDTPRSIQWGHLVALAGADNANPDSPAARFIDHLVSEEPQTTYPIQQSVLPVTLAARAAPTVRDDAYLSAWAAATGEPLRNEIGIWSNAADMTTIIGEEVQSALLGQKTPEEAIAAMQQRLASSMAQRG
ncbi:extracellular solute-binding protein [Salinarimonas sp.]|uniref:extracellular solute-binding protein n=1 Tax=Salinarimonas sp. TaxID=2766526 RepID=UPI00391CF24D